MKKRLVVGISGASGVIYGVRMLGLLKETDFETHLIISDSGRRNIEIETDFKAGDVEAMADHVYEDGDVGAHILPPVPFFYHQPKTIQDIMDQSIGKVFDSLGIEHELFRRWEG